MCSSAAVPDAFFQRDALSLAQALVGCVLRRRSGGRMVAAQIIETEAYFRSEAASHSSLGRTPSREAMFMPAGTLYLYNARGWASLNLSAQGAGDAVLIKSGRPWFDATSPPDTLAVLQANNPARDGSARPLERVCAGQTLLCRALDLTVPAWDGRRFVPGELHLEDAPSRPVQLLRTRRLGIPDGRDGHLPYRFVHPDFAAQCTANPLTKRRWEQGRDWWSLPNGQATRTH